MQTHRLEKSGIQAARRPGAGKHPGEQRVVFLVDALKGALKGGSNQHGKPPRWAWMVELWPGSCVRRYNARPDEAHLHCVAPRALQSPRYPGVGPPLGRSMRSLDVAA